MDMPPEHELAEQLGDELRTIRTGQGLTRKELRARLPQDLAVQSLATYELGTRHVTVTRLFQLSAALNVRPSTIIRRVEDQLALEPEPGFTLRLDTLTRSSDAELAPLRRWASVVLRQLPPDQAREIHLNPNAIERLAELCGILPIRLTGRLRRLAL
uniref:helix-turn-helix domain-containing protein n=1 Tax=Amycolatopsis sp. CA-151526 TaxID=3239921 RepID=UPI003F49812B